MFAWFAVIFMILEDNLARYGYQRFATGGIFLLAGIAGLGALLNAREGRGKVPMAAVLFVIWSGLLLMLYPSVQGVQNWMCWALLPMTALAVSATTDAGTAKRLYRWWWIASVISAVGYLALVAVNGLGDDTAFYAARPAAWTAALAMAFLVPWSAMTKAWRWPAVLQLAVAVTSLTRTATAVCGILLLGLAASRTGRGGRIRLAIITPIVLVGGYLAMTRFAPLRDRFLEGDRAVQYGGVNLNTSGRDALWRTTWDASQDHLWTGHGPGQSQLFIRATFGNIEHPHNEYLRMIYDTGIPGLILWCIGMIAFTIAAYRRFKKSDRPEDRAVHLAAVLGVAVLMLGGITDNMTVSIQCSLVVGTLLGMSMGRQSGAVDDLADETEDAQQPAEREPSPTLAVVVNR